MSHDADSLDSRRTPAVLRLLTIVIGSFEIIAFTLAAHLMLLSEVASGDPALLILAPLFGLTIPGTMLAVADRAPALALAMVALAGPAAVVALTYV